MASPDPNSLIRLSESVDVVGRIAGERFHIATIHRWASRGIFGVRLRTKQIGAHRKTCEAWINQFFDDVSVAAEAKRGVVDTVDRPDSRVTAAEARLKEAGI